MAILNRVWNSTTGRWELKAASAEYAQEIPSGAVNGVNTSFTLSATPAGKSSTVLFLDGIPQDLTVWSLDTGTKTITMNTAPAAGQSLFAYYLKA